MADAAQAREVGLRYQYLLGTILLAFLIIIAVPTQTLAAPLRILVLGGLLQMTLRLRRRNGRFSGPAWVLAAILLGGTVVASVFAPQKVFAVIGESSTIVLVATSIFVLATTLAAAKVVNTSVVRGVLSVYLLIALLFAAIIELGSTVTAHYLHGVSETTASNALYFSVITITTVGYGDITPGNALAQAMSAAEALIGQLYLVSIVAVVIARYRSVDRAS
jgi:hypothetical protein